MDKSIPIKKSINQLKLFGYNDFFNNFIKMKENNSLPNSILLSGSKGIGKSTFAYHFINYVLSNNENDSYLTKENLINNNNYSYKLLSSNVHPNFFLLECQNSEGEIKVDNVRILINFINKSTYSQKFKFILIDSVEKLNVNSSNALLKAIEEPPKNTFFFLIHDDSYKILNTIKSRASTYKLYFNIEAKRNIFINLLKQYEIDIYYNDLIDDFYFDSPGNLIKYISYLDKENVALLKNTLYCINYFIDGYINDKNPEYLPFISVFIEKYYNELSLKKIKNVNNLFFNFSNILKKIHEMKKFNLNKKDIFFDIKNILLNDSK